MADWTTPKTDWVAEDYFNATDYNRIVNNLLFLKDTAEEFFGEMSYVAMAVGKTYASMIYAREMNAIEDNLESLNNLTYILPIGSKMTYEVNGHTPIYTEYNRIESACLEIYKHLSVTPQMIVHLEFGLGKGYGIKRVKYDHNEIIGYRFSVHLGQPKGVKL